MSTSNDGTCRIRDLTGDTLSMIPHPSLGTAENFVFSGACIDGVGDEFLSCSEDNSAAVLQAGKGSGEYQLLEHPDGVWCGCVLPNGDVATGCNDSVVRFFFQMKSSFLPASSPAQFVVAAH